MAKKTFKRGTFTRSDNKPLTMGQLIELIRDCVPDQPVTLSSDEEGNELHHLWSVEISKTGAVTLWPAGNPLQEF